MMAGATRGFDGPSSTQRDPELPPGQYDTGQLWPVLTAEPTPNVTTESWSFTIDGLVEHPTTWTWDEFRNLPTSSLKANIHCVTSWSKFGMHFTGVCLDALMAQVRPLRSASFVTAFCHTEYTTNLPLADVVNEQAWVVWEVDGHELPIEHGGPARLLVPHLYFWKSAKWIAGLHLDDHDSPGFWERYGYHDHGDPWREERYQGD